MRLSGNRLYGLLSALGISLAMAGAAQAADSRYLDVRGGAKDGAVGYFNLEPSATVGNGTRSGVRWGNDASHQGSQQWNQQGNQQGNQQWHQPETMTDYAQADDSAYRVNQLEEQVRQLNGKLEELNFQILQMQEMIRKMQAETDFRLQELEGKQGALGTDYGNSNVASVEADHDAPLDESGDLSLGKSEPSEPDSTADRSGGMNTAAIEGVISGDGEQEGPKEIDGVELYDPSSNDQQGQGNGSLAASGEQPLGTLTFDENGQVLDTAVGKPLDLGAGMQASLGSATLPQSPDELYELGYSYIQSGNYQEAQKSFTRFGDEFPNDRRISDAMFWKGEALFAQQNYTEAAKVFLNNQKKWPDSPLGAQNMLKLGLSLAGMNQRELACVTYANIGKKYPRMSQAMKQKVVVEQKSAKCTGN